MLVRVRGRKWYETDAKTEPSRDLLFSAFEEKMMEVAKEGYKGSSIHII